jgi:hypothetical protein
MPGSAAASNDLPDPGGPLINLLCRIKFKLEILLSK